MKILIIGEPENVTELKARVGEHHQYTVESDHRLAEKFIHGQDVVFDFLIDENPAHIEVYIEKAGTFFFNAVKISLAELSNLAEHRLKSSIFGFNGLPTFLNLPKMEVSVLQKNDTAVLEKICRELNTEFLLTDDRVGMVTPRVICMIINEAYYTVQEGTASREDIDLAMKLGTNYPYGPFEWCQRIGVRHVYEVLDAMYEDTRDERYKICSLLKKEFLMKAK
ncbi:MAG: 3-hydroxyacyl-CoA dehydrogenase family protein [Flammeovirgaceae bacterium]|nr:3-hydroxyacyl-CoA dehydrogenase family protein [Flammeovirgaceae bacterium]